MKKLRSRKLLWRLVLFGVIELLIIAGVSAARFYLTDDSFDGEELSKKYEAQIIQLRDEPEALNELLQKIDREEGVETAFFDSRGVLVATGRPRGEGWGPPRRVPPFGPPGDGPPFDGPPRDGPPPDGPPRLGPGRLGGPPRGLPTLDDWMKPRTEGRRSVVRIPIQTKYGTELLGVRRSRRQPPGGELWALAAIMAVVAGVAALFARDLALPLEKLAATARAFGQGNLGARNNMRRKDELGEVAEAFDEMAGRVQALLQSQRELLANVSHELRTPLARIQVALDIAAEGNAEAARESLGGIGEDLAELNRLIDDILAAARLESADATGVPPLRKEPVALGPLLQRSAERFSAKHAHKLAAELQLPAELVLDADAVLLRRAFDNLLDNAGKYSEPSTTVSLLAKPADKGVAIEIRDQGMGMDEAELKQLFTPFFRSDKSRARKTGGVGLGLLLARRVIEAHGGQLTVASAPGQGTTVKATLPVARA